MRQISTIIIWSILLLFILAGVGAGQVTPPESIIDSSATRLALQDWSGYAELIHPTALREFAFYVLKITQIRAQTGAGGEEFDMIFGRPTDEEIKSASPEVIFANFLRAAVGASPEFARVLLQAKTTRLGVVDEGDQLKHVVVRQSHQIGDTVTGRVEVITLQKDGDSWKMHLPPTIVTFLDELGWPKTEG